MGPISNTELNEEKGEKEERVAELALGLGEVMGLHQERLQSEPGLDLRMTLAKCPKTASLPGGQGQCCSHARGPTPERDRILAPSLRLPGNEENAEAYPDYGLISH